MSEKEIENQILEYLWFSKVFCWKNDTTGIYDPVRKCFRKSNNKYRIKGVSDILGIYKGKFLAIEVKSQKGRLRPEQRTFLDNVLVHGGIAFMARSVGDVIKALGYV